MNRKKCFVMCPLDWNDLIDLREAIIIKSLHLDKLLPPLLKLAPSSGGCSG